MLWGPIRMCCTELHEWQFPNQCQFTVRSIEPQWVIKSFVLSTDLGCEHVEIIQDLFCLVLETVDTSDSPLLRSFCLLGSSIVGNVQFGTGPKLEL